MGIEVETCVCKQKAEHGTSVILLTGLQAVFLSISIAQLNRLYAQNINPTPLNFMLFSTLAQLRNAQAP
jgi:hypothetical protein